ncbi:MAG: glycosyltransferase [Ktedonobacteraceae bacterium]|nr:glycosyltransferase [Ktedonobacteraceae bacterium]
MKILFVAPYPISRIRIRSYGFVSQLGREHDVTVLMLCSTAREAKDVQALHDEGFHVIAVTDKRRWKLLRTIKALPTKKPLQVAFDASPAFRRAIQQQLSTGQFDLLHVEFIRSLGALPDGLSIPAVWDAVDCISLLYEHGAYFSATPMLHWIGAIEARRTRAYEYRQLARFRQILVTSERDRQALLAIAKDTPAPGRGCAEISVLPHGVDQEYYRPYVGKRHAETLVFSGKMSFHANIAGVLHLVEAIMPLIWQKRPGVRLIIAGSNPPASVRRMAQDARIEVTGYVPDMRPYIEQAQVAVCPLPYAVGIQNKILEAMALGTPVVASSHAAAGLLTTADQNLLIADQPSAFAASVLRLLEDESQWTRLSQKGLEYIATYHNWAQVVKQLTDIYARVVHSTKGI